MLEESSTTTATIFCCGRSVATLSAGCHSNNSNTDASKVWSSHTTADRPPFTRADVAAFRRTKNASPTAAARIAIASSHNGQPPANTKVPLENTEAGYLKK